MASLICGIQKDMVQMNLQNRRDSQTQRMNLQLPRGRASSGIWNGHAHTATFKWIPTQDLLCSAGNSAQCYMAAWRGGELVGRMDTCGCMAESLCCSPETITILIDCTQKQNEKLKKKLKIFKKSENV